MIIVQYFRREVSASQPMKRAGLFYSCFTSDCFVAITINNTPGVQCCKLLAKFITIGSQFYSLSSNTWSSLGLWRWEISSQRYAASAANLVETLWLNLQLRLFENNNFAQNCFHSSSTPQSKYSQESFHWICIWFKFKAAEFCSPQTIPSGWVFIPCFTF